MISNREYYLNIPRFLLSVDPRVLNRCQLVVGVVSFVAVIRVVTQRKAFPMLRDDCNNECEEDYDMGGLKYDSEDARHEFESYLKTVT